MRNAVGYSLATIILIHSITIVPAAAQQSPFSGLAGTWSGSGTISLSDGSKERLRCKATYRTSSRLSLQQSLRCASASYRFELVGNAEAEGGRVTGSWSETSRGVAGTLQGRVADGRITVAVDAPGFSANLSMNTTLNRQTIAIVSQGDIRNVTVSLTKN